MECHVLNCISFYFKTGGVVGLDEGLGDVCGGGQCTVLVGLSSEWLFTLLFTRGDSIKLTEM